MNSYIIFLVQIIMVTAITMKKEDILKMDLSQYRNKTACPDYSLGYINNIACSFQFYCLEEVCQSVKDNPKYMIFNVTTASGSGQDHIQDSPFQTKKFITSYCSGSNDFCTTEPCTENTDCISNHCVNGICREGGQSPFTECRDRNKSIFHPTQTMMVCGKLAGELCTKDEECAGKCYAESTYFDEEKEEVRCHPYTYQPFGLKDGLKWGIPLLVGVLVVLFFSKLYCRIRHRSKSSDTDSITGLL